MPIEKNELTKSVHAGLTTEKTTGAVIAPIFQTSTFEQISPGETKGFDYSRGGNPTRGLLEEALAKLEEAKFGLAFSSGLAAEQAIIQILDKDSHIIVSDDVYGGTGRLFRQIYEKYGLSFDFVDMSNIENIKNKINNKTKMIWIETPTNPTLKLVDIKESCKLAKNSDITVVVDNTFCSPVFQSPLSLGADIVVHSTTKYIGGHSDLIGGAIMTSNEKVYERLSFVQKAVGAVPSPIECFLTLRSIKTLALRMGQHEKNAFNVAKYLTEQKKIKNVIYPGLESHPQYDLAKKQMKGFSGIISFTWNGPYEELVKFTQSLELIILAESLGGVESLINHPEKMTHGSVPKGLREKLGIDEKLLRLSVGIENSDDIIKDLDKAIKLSSLS
ncbi:MAG: cystathionine gamma-synthase [Zetaproteobacteria bacterium]|mgnify:CR=1 FL=1|nr:cystathionine gamma-synthase [Pseudobdellovibrionaceae bacterium]|tara:strand:+ start:352 stop:1515 length:1164 start_codon:yes stop_codon:yes gene_type:complete